MSDLIKGDLIKIDFNIDDTPTVSGRELHEALGVKTRYADWFSRMCEYGFEDGTDYALVSQICETNNPKNPTTTRTDHQLTIPMAKELCMLQRTPKGKEFRQYFIRVEEAWNRPEAVMARALKIANRNLDALKGENHRLQQANEAMQPKALFADSVCASHTSILVGEMAKILKQNGVDIGQKRFFAWLRDNGYLVRRHGSERNMPTQRSMELKLFEVKETVVSHADGHTTTNKTPKITGVGQVYFTNKFLGRKDKKS